MGSHEKLYNLRQGNQGFNSATAMILPPSHFYNFVSCGHVPRPPIISICPESTWHNLTPLDMMIRWHCDMSYTRCTFTGKLSDAVLEWS